MPRFAQYSRVTPRFWLAARLGLAVLLMHGFAVAQLCSGTSEDGCTNSGAACRPVTRGTGITGQCQTVGTAKGLRCECIGATYIDLTGRWSANDGGVYYVRHIGNDVWWAGMSTETPLGIADLHKGLQFTNVFHGQLSGPVVAGGSSVVLTGDWAGVPLGSALGSGSLTINVSGAQMVVQTASGGFSARTWNRADATPPLPAAIVTLEELPIGFDPGNIFSIFNLVKKNQNAFRDHSLLDNLKPAKSKPVVVFGNLLQYQSPVDILGKISYVPDPADPAAMHVNYHPTDCREYTGFICLDGNNSPPDGDIDFDITVDRTRLDAQIGFWSQGWETGASVNATNFRNKLQVINRLHVESIMYGGTTECNEGIGLTMLPGWQQPGAAGVLLNGVPIAGKMEFYWRDAPYYSSAITKILGRQVNLNDRVRITGNLVLDCGHGVRHNCDEDASDVQNQEIHPVYSIDFVQDFTKPRLFPTLTGVWSADDAGTYYVRQLGTTVWWLGLSPDESPAYADLRQTFANVFQGTIQNGQVVGNWVDIPLGDTANSGAMQLALSAGPESTAMTRAGDAGAFSGASWEKLYDVATRDIVIGFESVSTEGTMPPTAEPFEFTIGGKRTEAQPQNGQPVSNGGNPSMRAEIGTRIPVTVTGADPLQISVAFAGHRANWTIPVDDLKPGVYTQTLTPPRVVPSAAPQPASLAVTAGNVSTPAPLTITYRIENASPPR